MSAFTDRLYRAWEVQNGYSGPRVRGLRGMGGVPPMMTQSKPICPAPSRTGSMCAKDATPRPEKQISAEKPVTLFPPQCTTVAAVCTNTPFFDLQRKNLQ